jgi:GNAT superfamily N-acetyltransferase
VSDVVIAPEPFDGPDATALLDAMAEELTERYGGEDPDYRTEVSGRELDPPTGTFLVARRDGEAVACGAVRRWVPHVDGVDQDPAVAEVKRMYVRPDARGRGLSRLLLAALEEAARDLGYAVVRLETGGPQHEAVALYESSGYRRIPAYGRYAASPLTMCFEKALG